MFREDVSGFRFQQDRKSRSHENAGASMLQSQAFQTFKMTMTPQERIAAFKQALTERILLLDGAMGTMIQRHKLGEADYRGERFADWPSDLKGNNDLLVLTQPDIIRGIHTAYLDAGADILETNTFNATRVAMADYGMEELSYEINVAAAKLARAATDSAAADGRPRYVAGGA